MTEAHVPKDDFKKVNQVLEAAERQYTVRYDYGMILVLKHIVGRKVLVDNISSSPPNTKIMNQSRQL